MFRNIFNLKKDFIQIKNTRVFFFYSEKGFCLKKIIKYKEFYTI